MGVVMKSVSFRTLIAGIGVFSVIVSVSAQTAVQKHGWLRTEGPYILNDSGNIVQLKGLSFYWSTPAWSGYGYYNEGTVDALVDSWKCTVVRAAYDRNGGNNNGWDGVQKVINESIKKGIYVIIDWHSHTAQDQQGEAIQFFKEQATKYKNTPNVIFEPYNEPINAGGSSGGTQTAAVTTWKAIKGYLTAVTQAIRDAGSKNLVVVGTPYYCQFVDVAAGDPLKDKNGKPFTNLAYAFHFYAASHGPESYYVKAGEIVEGAGGMEGEYLGGAVGKVPIFVTEWGTTHSNGGQEGKTYIDGPNTDWWFERFIDKYHLSWCNWSASSFEASSAFSGGTSPSASGQIVQKHIKNPSTDEFEPESKAGLDGPSNDSVFSFPGTHPAAGFNRYYGAYVSAAAVPYSYRDNQDKRTANNTCLKVGGGSTFDWARYNVKTSSACKALLVRCCPKDGGGSMEVYVDNKNVGSITLTKGKDWVTKCVDVDVGSGTHTVQFTFTDAQESGYLVEWFELSTATCATATLPADGANLIRPELRPLAVTVSKNKISIGLPYNHGFASYRLLSADGRTVSVGSIGRVQSTVTINGVSRGLWLLQLSGESVSRVHRVVVRGE
jgi:endoglucanase